MILHVILSTGSYVKYCFTYRHNYEPPEDCFVAIFFNYQVVFFFTSYLFVFFCLSLRACCFGFTLKCLPCMCAIIKQNEINVLFR